MTRINLPSGGWIELRDPRELKARDKKAIIRNMQPPDEAKPLGFALDVADGLACMLIAAWEIPYLPGAPLPSADPAQLDELTIPDYDAVMDAVRPAQELLFPRPATPDDHADPTSPTGPVSG